MLSLRSRQCRPLRRPTLPHDYAPRTHRAELGGSAQSDSAPAPRVEWRRLHGLPGVGKRSKDGSRLEARAPERRARRGPKSMSAGVQEAVRAKKAKRRARVRDLLAWRDAGYPGL
jgi:hypothetical protein